MSERYFAAVCLEGHIAHSDLHDQVYKTVDEFCRTCGSPVIVSCQTCGGSIDGAYLGLTSLGFTLDKFCPGCGLPYPWVSKAQVAKFVQTVLPKRDDLTLEQQNEVIEQWRILQSPDEPEKARVAAAQRIKKIAPQAWNFVGPVLQSVLTAAITSRIGIPPS